MTVFKRAWISIVRKKVKTGILFLTILLLGIVASAAISATQAILNAELNLRRNLPAVATIVQNEALTVEHLELYGEVRGFEWVTAELIETIGGLPQVRGFDYAIIDHGFFSTDVRQSRSLEPYAALNAPDEDILNMIEFMSLLYQEGFDSFRVKGVFRPEVLDVETGIIELLEGRVFTAAEMATEPTFVAIVSEVFAIENELVLGDTFTLHAMAFDEEGQATIDVPVALEIIGIFAPTVEMNQNASSIDIMNHIELNQLIYVPMNVSKSVALTIQDLHPDVAERFTGFAYEDVLFALYDPLDLEIFKEVASQLLPEFWLMDDLTNVFAHMSSSMEIVRELASFIVLGAAVATLLVLGILITLFLYDRKHEIGIYLALGEKRSKVIGQMLIEVVLTACVAIIIALFIGNQVASHLSVDMLRTELARQAEEGFNHISMGAFNDLHVMGHGIEMTHEEMLAAYSVSLDVQTIFIFALSSIAMIIFSTILPTIYLIRLKPKDILMKASIG